MDNNDSLICSVASPTILVQMFEVHWLWKQSISKEMNNENNLKFACKVG